MESNEIVLYMDAKVDVQDKRPESLLFKQWTRCEVKIEAVKCFPCFLRITFDPDLENKSFETTKKGLTISVNVPGVAITLASSRTKQYSYALFWTQNRRNCYIYFALDTEISCRRHMKWLKKSIKNLELHRKILLEERRLSRGIPNTDGKNLNTEIADGFDDSNDTWSQRVSEIYEEIFEVNEQDGKLQKDYFSRRCSRTSIASGIYEEMKIPINTSGTDFECIDEEDLKIPPTPPPLPSHRKRFNTYKNEEYCSSPGLDGIPRCSTNPETDLAKKKKYKNMLDSILTFHGSGLRSKRTVSASESETEKNVKQPIIKELQSPSLISKQAEDLDHKSDPKQAPIYANDDVAVLAPKRLRKPNKRDDKRNSFSSPDLSKINFIDTFDEQRIADMLNSFSRQDDLDFTSNSTWDDFELLATRTKSKIKAEICYQKSTACENHNISEKIPNNFNFSACNTSANNLIASLSSKLTDQGTKNKIVIDDLTGYCVMAPIVKKMSSIDNTTLPSSVVTATRPSKLVHPLEYLSSGYSTGSYSSSTSSCTNSTEDQFEQKKKTGRPLHSQAEESVVYESMQCPGEKIITSHPSDFTENLYENLLIVKAAQDLEHPSLAITVALSTSTPTDSPQLENATTPMVASADVITGEEDEEDYYQTPRKSIISIDEKIPSYYPNICENSARSRRQSHSPAKIQTIDKTPTSSNNLESQCSSTSLSNNGMGLRYLISSKLKRERKENLYQTSPQAIITTRNKGETISSNLPAKTSKTKKTAAHKISENVYAVTHRLRKTTSTTSNDCIPNNNNNYGLQENLYTGPVVVKDQQFQSELLQMAVLKNIDFKFEDTKEGNDKNKDSIRTPLSHSHHQMRANQILTTKSKANSGNISPATSSGAVGVMTRSSISTSPASSVSSDSRLFTSLPRFKKFDLSPLRLRINNACAHVLQRNHTPDL